MRSRRQRTRRRRILEPTINLTAMLDVIFNLLFFFLMATTIRTEEYRAGITLPSSDTGAALPASTDQQTLSIDSEGRVFFGGREVVEEELELQLRSLAAKGKKEIAIRGDREGKFGRVYELLDLCRRSGLTDAYLQSSRKPGGKP